MLATPGNEIRLICATPIDRKIAIIETVKSKNKIFFGEIIMARIHSAARAGKLEEIIKLLEKSENINSREWLTGWSPLHCSVANSHLEVVRLLLGRGADVHAIGRLYATPLHVAGNAEMVRELLAAGADPMVFAGKGPTPLHTFSRDGHTECVIALLDAGVDVDVRDENGKTPLCQAAIYGRTDTVRALLERGAGVNVQTTNGQTPLDLVMVLGNVYPETVELLKTAGGERAKMGRLEQMVEGEQKIKRAGRLISCVNACHVQGVRQLLDEGYDANLDDGDSTALHWALAAGCKKKGQLDIARLLISSGADVNIRTKTGQTSYEREKRWRTWEHVGTLVSDYLYSGSGQASIGLAPLDLTAMYDDSEITRLLIEAGADINAAGEDAETALHLSVLYAAEETARLLITAGADVNARTRDKGLTPLDWATRRLAQFGLVGLSRARTEAIVDLLKVHGGVVSPT